MEHSLEEFAVSLRQTLAEHPRGHPNEQFAVLRAFLAGGTEPGREAMRVNPPLHMLQNLIPSAHRRPFKTPRPISTGVEIVWINHTCSQAWLTVGLKG